MTSGMPSLLDAIFGKQSLEEVSLEEIYSVIEEFPSFNAAHFLLSKKLKDGNNPAYAKETKKTALYFNNPVWLQLLLDEDLNSDIHEQFPPVRRTINEDDSAQNGSPVFSSAAGQEDRAAFREETRGSEKEPGHVVPESEYKEPANERKEPEQAYQELQREQPEPEQEYREPIQEYNEPGQAYKEPEQQPGYPEPEPEYRQPVQENIEPESEYQKPQPAYAAPESEYSAPESEKIFNDEVQETRKSELIINNEYPFEPGNSANEEPGQEEIQAPATINEEYREPGQEMTVNEEYADALESVPVINEEFAEEPQPVVTVNEEYALEEAGIPTINQEFAGEALQEFNEQPLVFPTEAKDQIGQTGKTADPSLDLPSPGYDGQNQQPPTFNETAVSEAIISTPIPFDAKKAESIVFEPYHMIDYFASQGIKLTQEEHPADSFGKQLKSFTDWLKVMKRLPRKQLISEKPDEREAERIRHFAANSIEERDILTETMAEVLAKQGMYENAIALYQKLSLIYPPKSAYFASRIEQLKASLS